MSENAVEKSGMRTPGMGRMSSPSPSPPADGNTPGTAGLALMLPPEFVEAVAQRVAELLRAEAPEPVAASPFLTIPEAAEFLRCSRQRIDDLLSQRRLTRHKEGRRTLVARAELDAHVAA